MQVYLSLFGGNLEIAIYYTSFTEGVYNRVFLLHRPTDSYAKNSSYALSDTSNLHPGTVLNWR